MTLFKREYRASVRTKSFIIGLILVPLLMGGSFIVMMLSEKNKNVDDKKFILIDHTGILSEIVIEKANERNKYDIFDPEKGVKNKAAFIVENLVPDKDNLFHQQADLSQRIRDKELHAFIEIGPGILNPLAENNGNYLHYFSEHTLGDDSRYWFANTINNYLREQRISNLDLEPEITGLLYAWTNIETMSLPEIDKKSGAQVDAKKANEFQAFIVPYIIVMLMFMLTMMSAIPLLTSVMEEKTEKIAEVLLGTVTPFQFMMGKVLGGIGISLTTATVYVAGGIYIAKVTGKAEAIPYEILPWFFVFTLLFIIMVGSGMAALGATCNDNKDAQSMQFPAMLPVILPLFIMFPVIQDPMSNLAVSLSLIPPFTPILMMLRLATPVAIPIWQAIAGLAGVLLWTILTVWIGSRIFRTAILMQGQKPSLKNLFYFAFKN